MAVSPGLCLVSLLKPDQSPSSRQIFQVLSYLNYSQWKVYPVVAAETKSRLKVLSV